MADRSRREQSVHASGLSTGTPRFEESGMLVDNAKIIVEMTIGGSLVAVY
jgi:hypothetical protein